MRVLGRILGGPEAFVLLCAPGLIFRRLTQRHRTLPAVFLIGAPKGGSTSLAAYLEKHPSYVPAHNWELMYLQDLPGFTSNYEANRVLHVLWGRFEKGLDGYRKFFPLNATMRRRTTRTGARAVTGDHTPFYLYCRTAATRIRDMCPEAKLIVLLREPVDRTWSDFNMYRNVIPAEKRTFEQAIDEELNGTCKDFRRTYLHQGVYEPHLRAWMELFPRQQFLVVHSEELFRDPHTVVARTYDFLGLPPHRPGRLRAWNTGRYAEAMRPETRRMLREYFRPHNERLYELLGEDLGWD